MGVSYRKSCSLIALFIETNVSSTRAETVLPLERKGKLLKAIFADDVELLMNDEPPLMPADAPPADP